MPMDLSDRIQEASLEAMRASLFSHLREAHAQIATREELYKLIRQSDPETMAQSLASTRKSLPDYLFKLIEDELSEQNLNARIKAESRKIKPVAIEIPFQTTSESSTSPWTARILLPTRRGPLPAGCDLESIPVSLQNSIYRQVQTGITNHLSMTSALHEETAGDFDSIFFDYPTIRGGLISRLVEPGVHEALKLSFNYVEIPYFDLVARARTPVVSSIPSSIRHIRLTLSSIQNNLIPVRKDCRDFFPGYDVHFTLVTGIGEFNCKKTSKPHLKAEGGNYITGGLKRLLSTYQAAPGSTLVIRELEPKKRYFLDSVIQSSASR